MPAFSLRSKLLLLAWWSGLYLPPDRKILQKRILPVLAEDPSASRVLFVGVRFYTRHYQRLFRKSEFVTLDFDPRRRRFGAKEHVVDRVESLGGHFPPGSLDAIVINAVIGWGLDDPSSVNMALDACATALRTGGLLILGLDERRPQTPPVRGLSALRFFEPMNFPGLGTDRLVVATPFDEKEHTFLFYRRRQSASAVG